MRNLAFLAVLAVSAMALAGCSGTGDGDGDSTSSSSSSSRSSSSASSTSRSSSSSSSSSASPVPENRAPSGSMSATVNGTNATFALTGSDPDGDTIVWDLTFGDGGTTNGTNLPATVTHTYAGAGNFTANFTVTDGTDPVTYDIVVAVAGAGSGPTGQSVSGGYQTGLPGCGPANPAQSLDYSGATPLEGVAWIVFDVDPSTFGKPFTATFTQSPAGTPLMEVDFYLEDGAFADYFPADANGVATGDVPSDVSFAALYSCDPGPGSIAYTAG
ncbi:MAG TPA: PKD domain-containing protein [Candidatus Thermoplasmatota archaeon]|nr:PKD domain-containing protein [Candidatus Thermoplasmatota archaeon]